MKGVRIFEFNKPKIKKIIETIIDQILIFPSLSSGHKAIIINITKNLTILPPWVAKKNEDSSSIIIEPGSGFGTGSHPTTQLCLKWIEKNIEPDSTMLDYGCGSGILSIAANNLGCLKVTGIDNDKQALLNAERNMSLNSADVTFFHSKKYANQAKTTNASYCITTEKLKSFLPKKCKTIISDKVLLHTAEITKFFYPDSVTDDFDDTVEDIKGK